MKGNLGRTHRIVRLLLGVVLGALVWAGVVTGTWAIVLGIVAGIMLLTGLLNYCPMVTMGICPSVWVGKLFGKKG